MNKELILAAQELAYTAVKLALIEKMSLSEIEIIISDARKTLAPKEQ